jgi:hypothetical protein
MSLNIYTFKADWCWILYAELTKYIKNERVGLEAIYSFATYENNFIVFKVIQRWVCLAMLGISNSVGKKRIVSFKKYWIY